MKTFRKIYWLVIVIMIVFQLQIVNAQYAEDALRYSQLGLGISARQLGMGQRIYAALWTHPRGFRHAEEDSQRLRQMVRPRGGGE